ncbi:FAD:protein FMN transferase [soil metagenome]
MRKIYKYMNRFLNKSWLFPLILLLAIVVVSIFRQNKAGSGGLDIIEITGTTMGSIPYHVKYRDEDGRNFKAEIDSILVAFNQSLSTYIPDSEISRFNKGSVVKFELPFFYPVLKRSKEVHEKTGGAFDPTIAPLVNAWGFGPDKSRSPDKAKIDSLIDLVNFDSIFFDSKSVCKLKPGLMLDMSAIAKGYAVDVVADFLKSKNIENFLVEIGGEAVCSGTNERSEIWAIGIDDPTGSGYGQQKPRAIVKLNNRAIATSGNYRNFYEVNGQMFSHTISPFTGYPVQHSLLSASVFAEDCMTADAYATGFMVMGIEESIKIVESDNSLDAFFIYSDENGDLLTYTSKGIKDYFLR